MYFSLFKLSLVRKPLTPTSKAVTVVLCVVMSMQKWAHLSALCLCCNCKSCRYSAIIGSHVAVYVRIYSVLLVYALDNELDNIVMVPKKLPLFYGNLAEAECVFLLFLCFQTNDTCLKKEKYTLMPGRICLPLFSLWVRHNHVP